MGGGSDSNAKSNRKESEDFFDISPKSSKENKTASSVSKLSGSGEKLQNEDFSTKLVEKYPSEVKRE